MTKHHRRRANRDAFLRSAAGQYLVQFSDLSFKQQIGDGSVGRVHLGKWQVGSIMTRQCDIFWHWLLSCMCLSASLLSLSPALLPVSVSALVA
jgi:hypothetical protein